MNITLTQAEAIADLAKAEVYEDYSGRGMYGAQCVGFVSRNARAEAQVAVAITRALDTNAAEDMLDQLTTDDMGLGVIVYFPGITIAKEV